MLNKKKKTTTPTFEEKIKMAKYERIYQTLKDILKLEIKVVDKTGKWDMERVSKSNKKPKK